MDGAEARLVARWGFLENEVDPCTVVTRRMELVYVNRLARDLVPADWFGRRCWQAFPIADPSCAARCVAVRAVGRGSEIVYCEETLSLTDGAQIPLGVAVIPFDDGSPEKDRALLILRPKVPMSAGTFEQSLLADARRLQVHIRDNR